MDIQQKLIDGCIKRDRRAEHQLFTLAYPYLMNISYRYTGNKDKAFEVFNMGFYKILTNLDKYKPGTPFKPWARAIMVNTLINEYKKEKLHYGNVQYMDEYILNDDYQELNEALDKIDIGHIYALIAALPATTQQIFNLYLEGFKHREIAEILDIKEGTSKWHTNSAKEKLKEMIKKVEHDSKVASHE